MSYSSQTPYLGLPIRSASDTFNTLDNNDAFELTDTKVKEAVDNAAQATGDASDALNIAGEAKTIAEGAAGDIDAINATLDEHAERLVILSNRQTSQAAAIKIKAASTSIGDLYDAESGTYAVDDRIVYDGQLYQCVTAVTTPEDFDVAKWTPINIISILPSPGGSIDAEDVSFNDTLAQLGVNDVQDAIVALKTLIDNIGGGTMPILNYANPLATINPTNAYTAASDCYITGVIANAGSGAGTAKLTIDGTDVASVTNTGGTGDSQYEYIPPLAIKTGSVISVTGSGSVLHAFSEVTN